jgi:cytochrome c55X
MKATLLVVSMLLARSGIADVGPSRQNELIYLLKQDCGSCHGLTLKGGLGPALLPQTLASKPASYLVTTSMEGREGTAMPPWKSMLTRDEAAWLTRQLQHGRITETQLAEGEH